MGRHVFYNPVTGDRFHDLEGGFQGNHEAGRADRGITWHTLRGIRSPRG